MRILYILFITVLFILTLPLQFGIACIIALTSGFSVIFRQKRVGKNGIPFVMYKFRTMRAGAEKDQRVFRRLNEADGPVFKIHNDPRFTFVGKFLAHTGLDELPQLYNVLRGDMALIGPRPLPVSEAVKLKAWMQKRHKVLPGIISSAVLSGNYNNDFNVWMKSDVAYAKEKSIDRDITVLLPAFVFWFKLMWRALQESLF